LHVYDYDSNPTARGQEISPDAPSFIHPVVTLHPETGRRGLYVNRLMTHHLVGLPQKRSDELLDYLFNHQESPEFIYEHAWQPGDLIIWDNLCTLHAREDFDPGERRILRRLTVRGERPIGLEETDHRKANE
ncbi:MAG: TauD/TfdA family dioxygenase, partial [Candidatus Krumholzibacteria bacterium]